MAYVCNNVLGYLALVCMTTLATLQHSSAEQKQRLWWKWLRWWR